LLEILTPDLLQRPLLRFRSIEFSIAEERPLHHRSGLLHFSPHLNTHMTCIVGYAERGVTWIGGDSIAISEGGEYSLQRTPKVWTTGPAVIGTSGCFRTQQVLRHVSKIAPKRQTQDAEQWIVTTVIPRFRDTLSKAGVPTGDLNGSLMIGAYGRLFVVQADWAVIERTTPYAVIGSGGPYALGALTVLDGLDLEPEDRIKRALAAAEEHTSVVRGPWTICRSS
jgi:ATP-dependent protease HslVU (ClpYQ) peptidase subunit